MEPITFTREELEIIDTSVRISKEIIYGMHATREAHMANILVKVSKARGN